MKLTAPIYISPIKTEGKFENVFIEETSFEIKRLETYFKIDFQMYYLDNLQRVSLCNSFLAFQGMDEDLNNTNRKATFLFNDDEEEQKPRGFIQWITDNSAYPTNYNMVDWGYPTFEQVITFLTGGSFASPEINPLNAFVKEWIKNTVVMKGELVGNQFNFVI